MSESPSSGVRDAPSSGVRDASSSGVRDDIKTGIEIELLLPEGTTRLDLLDHLAARLGGTVERFDFPSKVPVPSGLPPPATLALIHDIARHHQAEVRGVSPDFRFFYLAHRAGRLRGSPLELQLVHDNTLAGGERVAELVTAPFHRGDLPALADVVRLIGAIDGVTIPDTAALHVHLDGAPFLEARALIRLIELFTAQAADLAARTRMPSGLRRAQPLPPGLRAALHERMSAAEVQATLRQHIPTRGHALNLYNLAAGEPEKLTVELKIAGSTLDPAQVIEVRELFVDLGLRALAAR